MATRRTPHRWTEAHVRRLYWRAGFGATATEARYWTKRGMGETIDWFLNGGSGPKLALAPARVGGRPLDPINEHGHDVLWWLDRMLRTPRPLTEKLTLFWHDHFATIGPDRPLQLAQNKTLRRNALKTFRSLLHEVTKDPAMLLFLSLSNSDKREPNENYARELMELFTLGSGYTETDIREAARALTGFRSAYRGDGNVTIAYEPAEHDAGAKRIFGKRGNFAWRDVLDLCIAHPNHAPFLVGKLWDYFVDAPIEPSTRLRLAGVYRHSGHQIKPVVGEILQHPALYRSLDAPDMVKSPVVFLVGALRACRQPITRDDWARLLDGMGQQPFNPPSVAGWEWGTAWLSTNTMRSRFDAVDAVLQDRRQVRDGATPTDEGPREAVARARSAVGAPWTSPATDGALMKLATRLLADDPAPDLAPLQQRADMCQRALRQLLLSGPDAHVH